VSQTLPPAKAFQIPRGTDVPGITKPEPKFACPEEPPRTSNRVEAVEATAANKKPNGLVSDQEDSRGKRRSARNKDKLVIGNTGKTSNAASTKPAQKGTKKPVRATKSAKSAEEPAKPPRPNPVFILPDEWRNIPKQVEEELHNFGPTQVPRDDGISRCPVCREEVLDEDLQNFKIRFPLMRVREQQHFCKQHNLKTARLEYEQRGYPIIQWDKLEHRLETKHISDIPFIMERPEKSHFRKLMEARLESGLERTLFRQLKNQGSDAVSMGYYGPRGMQIM
jgi:hypothetical protein